MLDISIDRTTKQEVEFIFHDIWTEGHVLVTLSAWRRLLTPSSFMQSRSLIRMSLNFLIVKSLRYFSAWRTVLNMPYVENLSWWNKKENQLHWSLCLVPKRLVNHEIRDTLFMLPAQLFLLTLPPKSRLCWSMISTSFRNRVMGIVLSFNEYLREENVLSMYNGHLPVSPYTL